ncbi:PBP1A family penicillin-binding protein [Lactobacillus taiwanensis]|uniref:PBP1A family penicillin-binding protein n=1 Tax=Lactobacillus taiwanensis TaxID=508451 RepID=UPI000B99CB43|nr:PBP1A family penicillin-binding protein [Lactobacillus taiwanensis]OYR96768.1 penicillin-binding protein [Lactobacillus taiwanensis]OYR99390.1 penicillin-binding protein [Lactobacillus taiwanensis]OYS15907.1 penicillin-binding protein [Lactobacillus taiwanensis]OYS32769.1 penicillin-binding protein [Lactobacillus taiwanensis]OYS34692.1 penicillin-binding protein [Lactobacillus taiwanensis]
MADNNQRPTNSRMANLHPNKGKSRKRIWLQVIKWFFIVAMLVVVSGIGLFAYYAKDAPSISQAQLQSGGTSSLYTRDGKFLLSLGSEKRTYVNNEEIPKELKNAIISVEDRRFYKEGIGLDPIRIIGSVLVNARSKGVAAGGSTITQQLVKLSVFSTAASQRTLRRKAQEAWLSMKVEREFSKEQILEFYINKVYMNYGNYGMGTAADYYYGKDLKDLDLAQTALLAGMPNAPVTYDPYVYPEKAKYRRDIVLKSMLRNDKISKAQYQEAINEPITQGLQPRKNNATSELRKVDDPYIKEVISEVKSKGFNPYNDNLKITVNIDQDAQQKLYDLVNDGSVPFTNDKMQVGATIVDPRTGHIIAIIGGRKLPSVQLGLNRAVQTGRSTGSTIKPVLDYGPAIEYLNWPTSHMLDDSKYVYPGTNIQLYDWDNKYEGKITMRHALEQSRNVPAVKTLSKVGVARASLFARKMGVNVPSDSGLSVAIGANASSLQMAGAFAAFANNGIYHKPQFVSKIETPDGLTRNYDSNGTKVMKESTAYIMTDMLKGVLTKGSGTQARIKNLYEAGKTGTVKYSDEELVRYPQYKNSPKDSWFVGYTKLYSIGIWTGYDNLKDGTPSGVGASSAQLLYKQMMSYLMKDKANKDWNKPSTVVRRRIANGTQDKVVSPNASNSSWQLFVKGHAPSNPYSEVTVDKRKDEEDDDIDTRIDTEDDTSSKGQSHSQISSSSSSRSQQSSSQKQSSTSENRNSNNQNNNQQNNNNSQQQNQNNQNNNQNQQRNQKNNSNNH